MYDDDELFYPSELAIDCVVRHVTLPYLLSMTISGNRQQTTSSSETTCQSLNEFDRNSRKRKVCKGSNLIFKSKIFANYFLKCIFRIHKLASSSSLV